MKLHRCSRFLQSAILSIPYHPRIASGSSTPQNNSVPQINVSPFDLQQFPISSPTNMSNSAPRLAPVISISHGGGPMPALGDPSHAAIVKSLSTRVPQILKLGTPEQPRAIVLVTAHWQTAEVKVSSGKKHEMYYDYGGFPGEAYTLTHDAPGSPEVAEEVKKALEKEGVKSSADSRRGWDHGVFIPMMLINPQADIPIVQVSILASESPSAHFAYGRALAALRAQNIAIIGSGFASWHNLHSMMSAMSGRPIPSKLKALNEEWSRTIQDAVTTEDESKRAQKFEAWRMWPGSYEMHPNGGADHFMPLIVCAGAGGAKAAKSYSDEFWGFKVWSFYWE